MRTVLFVVGPALGHAARSLVVARAVRDSSPDTRIAFANVAPGYGDRLARSEFTSISLRNRRHWSAERFADELERVVASTEPDLICLDLDPVRWLRLVRFPESPRAYLTNYFLTSPADFDTMQARVAVADLNRNRSRRGLSELRDSRCLYEADAVLLCDPPGLASGTARFPDHYHNVGPCVWEPAGAPTADADSAQRLLFVGLGSTGRKPLPSAIPDQLARTLGCDGTVTVASQSARGGRRQPHPEMSFRPLGPLLERAVLAVTQGGVGTTYAALRAGVPSAIWPTHQNHGVLADELERARVGVRLTDLAELEPDDTRRRVDAMRSECRRFSADARAGDGADRAANVLLSLV